MEAIGRAGERVGSGGLRRSDASPADLDAVDEIDRTVRGVARRRDVIAMLEGGARLFLDDAGAYGLASDTEIAAVCSADPAGSRRLLADLLSGAGADRPRTARWLTAATPWAFEAAAEVRATLRGHGAVMTRGSWPERQTWLPSGVYG